MIKFKNICPNLKNLWFVSDTHFQHLNICKGTTKWEGEGTLGCRDFKTLDTMNDVIINGINKHVKEDDVLIHLGDVAFQGLKSYKEFTDRVNCKNILLIQGNHDHNITFTNYSEYGFKEFNQLAYYSCEGYNFLCSHYPFYSSYHQSHKGAINIFGHVHGSLDVSWKAIDVGIDNAFKLFREYRPINGLEIVEMMNKKNIEFNSHHDKNTN